MCTCNPNPGHAKRLFRSIPPGRKMRRSWIQTLDTKTGHTAPGPGCVSHHPPVEAFSTDILIHNITNTYICVTCLTYLHPDCDLFGEKLNCAASFSDFSFQRSLRHSSFLVLFSTDNTASARARTSASSARYSLN